MVPAAPPFTLYPTDISSSFHESLAYVIIISFITSGLYSLKTSLVPLLWNPSCHLFILSLLGFKVSVVSRLSLYLCVWKTHISFVFSHPPPYRSSHPFYSSLVSRLPPPKEPSVLLSCLTNSATLSHHQQVSLNISLHCRHVTLRLTAPVWTGQGPYSSAPIWVLLIGRSPHRILTYCKCVISVCGFFSLSLPFLVLLGFCSC